MILRARAKKANGLSGAGYWYVCSKYMRADGTPSFTISTDINKAAHFDKEQAQEFNRLFMMLGQISAPFEISK